MCAFATYCTSLPVLVISDDDMKNMLDQMANMGPEEEARMRAMGMNPEMMKKSVQIMNNPIMRNAAKV